MFTGYPRGAAAKIGAGFTALIHFSACGSPPVAQLTEAPSSAIVAEVVVGAERTSAYLPLLADQRVAVVTNQTGLVAGKHVVDVLLEAKVNVVKVFAPEHGFRGDADAGEHVKSGKDQRTGLPLVSLYGDNKKPRPEQIADVDVLVFDIQDVGVRFYTYLGTLHYVMEAAAENGKKVVVLDRPNPHGSYVDGPVLDMAYRSFVGMHPVPLVHGMTVGEYARMMNGEGWLKNGAKCDLAVVTCTGYGHGTRYGLPVRPSPNLPNTAAVQLYPSLGLFEGTIVSVGRGTDKPFQCIGYPACPVGSYAFTPRSVPGAKDPPHKDKLCTGLDLQEHGAVPATHIDLQWLISMYNASPDRSKFFTPFFDKLAGGTALREQVTAGLDEAAIRASWQDGLERFRLIRAKYMLYP